MKDTQLNFKPVKGGVYFPPLKQDVLSNNIERIPIPKQLFYPLTDQRGHKRVAIVENGTEIRQGQQIAISTDGQSVPIHASSSGVVLYPDIQHPEYLIIATDLTQRTIKYTPIHNPLTTLPEKLIKCIEQAGITGMGGAGYPAHLKLQAALNKQPETLILNAVECDPFTTCDSILLMETLGKTLDAAALIMHISAATHCMIAIEDHQVDLYKKLSITIADRSDQIFELVAVPSKYPSGSEQQLVQSLTGKTMRLGQTALDVGVICFNITTVMAIYQAITTGKPLIERLVSVSGLAKTQVKNILVAIGTPIEYVLSHCEIKNQNITSIQGGMMMGHAVDPSTTPIVKETYSIWITKTSNTTPHIQPCIRCGECAYVCPTQLQPQSLFQLTETQNWKHLERDNSLSNCIECRACDLVCPSHIPLSHIFVQAKQQLSIIKQSQVKAQHAQNRYHARQQRLARIAAQKQQSIRKHKKPTDVNDMITRIKRKVENNNL